MENKKVVKKIKKGNLVYLLDWMLEREEKLYKIGWSYLYSHQDIEDVFQNTLLKAYENINSLKNDEYFETWVISIYINECRMILRNKKRELITENIELEGSYVDEYNYFCNLNSLNRIHREVIVLKYISQYTQEEIAEILNVPIGTVKSRLYRGLKLLRKEIKEVEK